MTCTCVKPEKTNLWSPIPEFRSPTEILPGENIDCYAKRAGTQGKNDIAETPPNKIDNTSLVTNLSAEVNETFKLTPNSTVNPTSWILLIDNVAFSSSTFGPTVLFNPTTGVFKGSIPEQYQNKQYKVLVKAMNGASEIDSREFNFVPKKGTKEDTVTFVFPFAPNGRVTCKFGPRKPPAAGASSMHKGIDISAPGSEIGFILSAGDGTVVKCGPAKGFGNWIVIEHRDTNNVLIATTVYGHMNEIYVKVGQKVAAGQKIAKEGNAGIGSAAHLHFEMHKGAWGNPVDPLPYINGNFAVAQNNLPGEPGIPDPNTFTNANNKNRGMTTHEVEPLDTCPLVLRNQYPSTVNISSVPETVITTGGSTDVISEIKRALDEDVSLTADDKKFILFLAKIESTYNAKAKNNTTSALGLYQMVDATAVYAFKKIGIAPTYENRIDPYLATKAQIYYYKNDQVKYHNEFKTTQKIAGKIITADLISKYNNLTKNEFIYMLHHDGVGNVVKGKDMQGLDYYRKKVQVA